MVYPSRVVSPIWVVSPELRVSWPDVFTVCIMVGIISQGWSQPGVTCYGVTEPGVVTMLITVVATAPQRITKSLITTCVTEPAGVVKCVIALSRVRICISSKPRGVGAAAVRLGSCTAQT